MKCEEPGGRQQEGASRGAADRALPHSPYDRSYCPLYSALYSGQYDAQHNVPSGV